MAIRHLRACGFRAVATEVSCPLHRYRVDVAGYLDSGQPPAQQSLPIPRTVIIECKQSRADFYRHADDAPQLRLQRDHLRRIVDSIIEHHVKPQEPHLRQSSSMLFSDLEDWDLAESRHPAYRESEDQLLSVEEKLHGNTKFYFLSRYRLADQLYIAAPQGLIASTELPSGWGLLECPVAMLNAEEVNLDASHVHPTSPTTVITGNQPAAPEQPLVSPLFESSESVWHNALPHRRARLLRNIAIAACSRIQ
ncbi:MAG TPA: hypothetical protein VG711_13170 [Phycisphaerales bacterium]|nr:hypothetical protein [Phycisphaerales bacterium]